MHMSLAASYGKDENKYGLFASDNTGLFARGEEIMEDSVTAYSASSEAAASMPVKSTEQEEYAKEWAHKPRRIVLFVEPSPFSYVFISLLQIRLSVFLKISYTHVDLGVCRFSRVLRIGMVLSGDEKLIKVIVVQISFSSLNVREGFTMPVKVTFSVQSV